MIEDIRWQDNMTTFTGRNGSFKCSGVEVISAGEKSGTVTLTPFTSRDILANCAVVVPLSKVPELITALRRAAGMPDEPPVTTVLEVPVIPKILHDPIRALTAENHDLTVIQASEALRPGALKVEAVEGYGMDTLFELEQLPHDDPVLKHVPVRAEVHDDFHAYEIDFDARLWLDNATFAEVQDLQAIDWGGDGKADEVARYMEDEVGGEGVEAVFEHCLRTDTGYECSVNGDDALAYLYVTRPDLFLLLTDPESV